MSSIQGPDSTPAPQPLSSSSAPSGPTGPVPAGSANPAASTASLTSHVTALGTQAGAQPMTTEQVMEKLEKGMIQMSMTNMQNVASHLKQVEEENRKNNQ